MPLTYKKASIFDIVADALVVQDNYYCSSFGAPVKDGYINFYNCFGLLRDNYRNETVKYEHDLRGFKQEFQDLIGKSTCNNIMTFQLKLFNSVNPYKYVITIDPVPLFFRERAESGVITRLCMEILRQRIEFVLQFCEEYGIYSVSIPFMGLGINGFPLEWAAIITVQSINKYLSENNSNLNVNLLFSDLGLPYELFVKKTSDRDLNLAFMQTFGNVYFDTSNKIITEFMEKGLEVYPTLGYFEEKDTVFSYRKKFEAQYKRSRTASDTLSFNGISFQINMLEENLEKPLMKKLLQNSEILASAVRNFLYGMIDKLPKPILLRLGISMGLSLFNLCYFIWMSGEEFPYDPTDYMLLEQLQNNHVPEEFIFITQFTWNNETEQYFKALYEMDLTNNRLIDIRKHEYLRIEERQYEILDAAMNDLGITKTRLSEICDISKTTLTKFISGTTKKFTKETAIKIALGLRLPIEKFCMFVWGSGEYFPDNEDDIIVMQSILQGEYDIMQIEDKKFGAKLKSNKNKL